MPTPANLGVVLHAAPKHTMHCRSWLTGMSTACSTVPRAGAVYSVHPGVGATCSLVPTPAGPESVLHAPNWTVLHMAPVPAALGAALYVVQVTDWLEWA